LAGGREAGAEELDELRAAARAPPHLADRLDAALAVAAPTEAHHDVRGRREDARERLAARAAEARERPEVLERVAARRAVDADDRAAARRGREQRRERL